MIKKIVQFVPLAVIASTLLYTCLVVITNNTNFHLKHIIAMFLIFANIIFYLAKFNQRIGRRITLVIILMGLFNVIGFTPVISAWFIGIGKLRLHMQPYSFLILIIFLACNFPSLEKYRK